MVLGSKFGDFAFSATFEDFKGGERDVSEIRLMVVDATKGEIFEDMFSNIGNYLHDDDVLAINDVGMGPSRLKGVSDAGIPIDVCFLMLKDPQASQHVWDVVILSEQPPPTEGGFALDDGRLSGSFLGKTLDFDGPYWLEKDRYVGYRGLVSVAADPDLVRTAVAQAGLLMHPWYTDLNKLERDRLNPFLTTRNDAVHVSEPARRLTPALQDAFRRRGMSEAYFSLSMCFSWRQTAAATTFAEYRMNEEEYSVPQRTVDLLNDAIANNRRIVSIGTSGARTLESLPFPPESHTGRTDIFISPGFEFKYCSVLLTNLHNPLGTHVVMAGAFGGRDLVVEACERAVRSKMKFGIHGDAMLVIGDFVPSAFKASSPTEASAAQ